MQELITLVCQDDAIENIHHIHLWRLDDHRIHLEAHLDFKQNLNLEASNHVTQQLTQQLHDTFGIEHTTFQCEYNRDDDKAVIA